MMEAAISKLSGHCILYGYGRVVRQIVRRVVRRVVRQVARAGSLPTACRRCAVEQRRRSIDLGYDSCTSGPSP
jgi:hypothetical protein